MSIKLGNTDINKLYLGSTEIKKAYLGETLIFGGVATMTIETTSTSSSWSPGNVGNTGDTLVWEVSGGVTIPPTTINDPTFDLSSNTGVAIVTAKDVSNLYQFWLFGSSSIDITKAINLQNIDLRFGTISVLDLTKNIELTGVKIGNNNISSLDVSNCVDLSIFWCQNNNLTTIDLSGNPLLGSIQLQGNPLTPTAIDNVLIDLDNHGLSSKTLFIPTGRTSASDTAYNNLITKNWTITES